MSCFRLRVGQTTCFGISQAPGTSVSRGVRGNALVKASERLPNGRLYLFGVNENIRSNAVVDGLTLAVR
jgi:hypothetical protein